MARRRRWLLGVAAAPVAGAGLLYAELKSTQVGPPLVHLPPTDHDGRVGGDGEALRMLWLGDSTVAGAGATSAATSVPRRVAVGLDRPVDVLVRAVAGARARDVADQQLPLVAALEPDVVLLGVGTNDVIYRTPLAQWADAHERFVAGLPEGVQLVVLGSSDMGAPTRLPQPLRALAGWRTGVLDRAARAITERAGGAFVGLADRVGPAMRRDPDRYLAEDRLHPGDEGYRLWAEATLDVLRPLLAQRAPTGCGRGDR